MSKKITDLSVAADAILVPAAPQAACNYFDLEVEISGEDEKLIHIVGEGFAAGVR